MIVYKNEITSAYCCGYPVKRIVACGETVWEKQEPTPPTPTGYKVMFVENGVTKTIQCNSSSKLDWLEFLGAVTETSAVTSAVIGECVDELGEMLFNDAYHYISSITIPYTVTTIGKEAFTNCDSLSALTIPSGVTVIDDYVFTGCYMLSSVNIPSGVTSIGKNAYYDCLSLMDITIQSAVTSIDDEAFRCANWVDGQSDYQRMMHQKMLNVASNRVVRCLATTPPTLGSAAFSIITGNGDIATYPIFVPAESLQAYKTATNWEYIANRIFPIT